MILSHFEASLAAMRFRQTLTRCTAGSVETVTRLLPEMPQAAYADGQLVTEQGHSIPFYGSGPLLKIKQDHASLKAKTYPVLMQRSAGQGLALHGGEVLGKRYSDSELLGLIHDQAQAAGNTAERLQPLYV